MRRIEVEPALTEQNRPTNLPFERLSLRSPALPPLTVPASDRLEFKL